MILIGYRGIGKTYLARMFPGKGIIDLDPRCAIKPNGKRNKDWYIQYCQLANSIGLQGNIVMVENTNDIRDFLGNMPKNTRDKIAIAYPNINLRDEYLRVRKINETGLKFEEDIQEIISDIKRYNFISIEMESMKVTLLDILKRAVPKLIMLLLGI